MGTRIVSIYVLDHLFKETVYLERDLGIQPMDSSIVHNIKNRNQAKCLSKWLSLGAPLCHRAVWPGLEGEDKDGEDTPALEPS